MSARHLKNTMRMLAIPSFIVDFPKRISGQRYFASCRCHGSVSLPKNQRMQFFFLCFTNVLKLFQHILKQKKIFRRGGDSSPYSKKKPLIADFFSIAKGKGKGRGGKGKAPISVSHLWSSALVSCLSSFVSLL